MNAWNLYDEVSQRIFSPRSYFFDLFPISRDATEDWTLSGLAADSFLSIPFGDMVIFSVLVGLAIYWRRKPELHRRLLFIGTCGLLDAAFGRFDYLFNHNFFFLAVDAVILLGVARDLLVNGRIHIVYRVALPSLVVVQVLMVYLWRGAPAWWSNVAQALLG